MGRFCFDFTWFQPRAGAAIAATGFGFAALCLKIDIDALSQPRRESCRAGQRLGVTAGMGPRWSPSAALRRQPGPATIGFMISCAAVFSIFHASPPPPAARGAGHDAPLREISPASADSGPGRLSAISFRLFFSRDGRGAFDANMPTRAFGFSPSARASATGQRLIISRRRGRRALAGWRPGHRPRRRSPAGDGRPPASSADGLPLTHWRCDAATIRLLTPAIRWLRLLRALLPVVDTRCRRQQRRAAGLYCFSPGHRLQEFRQLLSEALRFIAAA